MSFKKFIEEINDIYLLCQKKSNGKVEAKTIIELIIAKYGLDEDDIKEEISTKLDPHGQNISYTKEELQEVIKNWIEITPEPISPLNLSNVPLSSSTPVANKSLYFSIASEERSTDYSISNSTKSSKEKMFELSKHHFSPFEDLYASLESKHQTMCNKYEEQKNEIKRLRHDLNRYSNLDKNFQEYLEYSKKLETEIETLREEISSKTNEIRSLREVNGVLNQSIVSAEGELKRKTMKFDDTKTYIQELEEKLTKLSNIGDYLIQKNENLRSQNSQITLKNKEISEQLSTLEDKNIQLHMKINELNKNLTDKEEAKCTSLLEEIHNMDGSFSTQFLNNIPKSFVDMETQTSIPNMEEASYSYKTNEESTQTLMLTNINTKYRDLEEFKFVHYELKYTYKTALYFSFDVVKYVLGLAIAVLILAFILSNVCKRGWCNVTYSHISKPPI